LAQEINDCVYTSSKYPLIIDASGQAAQFLKYRARYLSIFKKGDFEKESLRTALVQALHNGAWLVLDFDNLECDLSAHFDKDHFPESVLSPLDLFLEETCAPLLRAGDEFTAKVTYEHQEALAVGAFQERTKAHAPERVAVVNKRFMPKDAFRLIVCTKKEDLPGEELEKLVAFKVQVSEQQIKDNAGVWAGREKPRQTKSKEQIKLDEELLELAFDGDADEVKKVLEKGADPLAKEGRGHTALSEAAVKGHLETVRVLLDCKAPIGSDPNAQGSDGRSALHKASFQGFVEVMQLLLERGADPRLKDLQSERPFDLAPNDECRSVLEKWDEATTDKLKEERKKALDEEDANNVKSEEERLQLERRRTTQQLVEYIKDGDKDLLETALNNIEDARQIPMYRDDRGNNVLHLAVEFGRLEMATMLVDDFKVDVNSREAKGWTPIAIAAFRGHKKVCLALMERKADPSIPNAYRKDAYDVAHDDEIRDTLKTCVDGPKREPAASSSGDGAADADREDGGGAAKAKAKAKAKGKAKAAPSDGGAAGSGAAAAKALAKGKAKGKAKAKAK